MNLTMISKPKCLVLLFALALLWSLAGPALAYDSQTSREAGVLVNVQPSQLAPGRPAVFRLLMNTHSVELDQDLTAVSVLSDDLGNQYRPSGWKGSPPGGHHRRGELSFPALNSKATQVKLVIKDIGRARERSFAWKLER